MYGVKGPYIQNVTSAWNLDCEIFFYKAHRVNFNRSYAHSEQMYTYASHTMLYYQILAVRVIFQPGIYGAPRDSLQ